MAIGLSPEFDGTTGEIAQHSRGGSGFEIPLGLDTETSRGLRHCQGALSSKLRPKWLGCGDDQGE